MLHAFHRRYRSIKSGPGLAVHRPEPQSGTLMNKTMLLALWTFFAFYTFEDVHVDMLSAFGVEAVAEAPAPSAYEAARDLLNGIENIQPSFIEVGRYKPALMTDDMDGIWLEYQARNYNYFGLVPHYIRMRDLDQIRLGQTASGVCQLTLSGPGREVGYYWDKKESDWARGLATLNFRSNDCQVLTRASEAFAQLIELDGGNVSLVSSLN
ncbi:MAG: hypothetical protein ACX94B_16425 [Henriciella sp.]